MNDDNMKKNLEDVGFSKNEIKIYLELLKIGKNSKSEEIVKRTKIHKTNVYHCLNTLAEKGFISETKINNVRHYGAYDIDKIVDVFEEKQEKLENQKKKIINNITLFQKNWPKVQSSKINNYTGNGIKTILYDILKELKKGDTTYSIGSSGDIMLEKFKYYFPSFIKKRVEKGIIFKGIFSIDDRKEFQNEIPLLTEAKFLNSEKMSPMQIMIYKNKVAIFVMDTEMQAVLIENDGFAKSQIEYFNFMWNSIKEKPLSSRKNNLKK